MVPGPPTGTDHGFGHVPGGGGPFQLAGGDGLFLLQGGDQIAVPQLGIDPRLRRTNPATGFPVNPVQRLQQGRWLAKPEGLTMGILQRQLLALARHLQGKPPCSCVAPSTGTAQAENGDMPLAALPELIREPLNKSKSSTIRLLLPLSLQGFPRLIRAPGRLVQRFLSQLEDQMKTCAQDVEFEEAAKLRDRIRILRQKLMGSS